jgi:GntR family transcriptional regulator, rspAB operon transcriptional repressor
LTTAEPLPNEPGPMKETVKNTTQDTVYSFLPALDRQRRGGMVQRVQDLIRDAIVRNELKPGTFIDKTALCAQLGVSRFPVSEALGRLADQRLVEVLPQRGTRVTPIDFDDCRQAMFIRRALELEAIRSVAPHASDGFLARIEENLLEQKLMLESDSREGFYKLDLAFHDLILSELGFERVNDAVEGARASLNRMRLLVLTPERRPRAYAEHVAIAEALKRHDPVAASQAMQQHLDMVMQELFACSDKHPEAFARNSVATTVLAERRTG